MRNRMVYVSFLLTMLLLLLPFAAEQTMAAEVPEMTVESEENLCPEQMGQEFAKYMDLEGMETSAVYSSAYSYLFPNAGVSGAKWVRGDKIILPFHVYSTGNGNEYLSIYLSDAKGNIVAKYANKAFRNYESTYTLNLTISNSETFAPGAYYILYYATKDQGNQDSVLTPIYVEEYSEDTQYSTASVDIDFLNTRYTIGQVEKVPFKLTSVGYGGQEYFCNVYDSQKQLIASTEGKIPLQKGETKLELTLSRNLRPGTYYVCAWSTYEAEGQQNYLPFYVENNGVSWEYDSASGTLTFFGKGPMPDYGMWTRPWYAGMSSNEIESLVVEPGITSVGNYVCCQYYGLKRVSLPDTVTRIGDKAFYKCTSLTEITLPIGLRKIGLETFKGCGKIETLVLPNNLEEIGNSAFSGCTALKSVITKGGFIQSGTDAVGMGQYAFEGCTSLKTVYIPAAIRTLDHDVFESCGALREIYFQDRVPMLSENSFSGITANVFYPPKIAGWTADVMRDYGGSITWMTAQITELDNVTIYKVNPHTTGNIIYWEATANTDLYQIYRLRSGESSWTLMKNTRSFAFKDETAEVGVKYYYKIVARNGDVKSDIRTTASAGVTRPAPKLDNVVIYETIGHATGNILRWNPVNGAKLYQVYRLQSGTWTLLKNTGSLAYKDETAPTEVKSYYKVVARNGNIKSDIAATSSVSVTRPGAPVTSLEPVEMIQAVGHSSGIIVSWNAVENAKLYQIYRRASNESAWTLLKNTGSLAYKDTEAVSGVRYYYKVVARNGDVCSTLDISAVSAIRP